MAKRNYTHTDGSGMPWRMDGSRPVSALADKVMEEPSSAEILNSIEAGKKRGGARKGAGAKKKKNPMVVLTVRVPKNQKAKINSMVKNYLRLLKNPLLLNQTDNHA